MFHRLWTPWWVRLAAIVAAAVAVLAAASTAWADGDQWQPWSGSGSAGGAPAATDNQNSSQPLVYNMAPAMGQAAAAEAQYDRASINLTDAQIRTRTQFQHSAEYRAAQRELQDAQDAYESACQDVLADLRNNPAYHALLEKRTQTQIALDNNRGDKPEMVAIATLKMEYSAAASRMEAEALGADSQVRDAKVRLEAAGQTLQGMTERFEDSFPDRPAIASAWQNYQNSIVNQAGAQGYLEGAFITRSDMMLANAQRYSAPQPNCWGGWGYPYGCSPYWYGYYGIIINRRF